MFACLLRTHARSGFRSAALQPKKTSILLAARFPAATTPQTLLRLYSSNREERNPTSQLFLGNLPWSADATEIRDTLSKFGDVKEIRIGTFPDGRSRGFAHVEFHSMEDAQRVVNMDKQDPLFMQDRDLIVNFSGAGSFPERHRPPSPMLFIANLPFSLDVDGVREIFSRHGEIKEIRIGYTNDGRSRGFAHVEYYTEDCAKRAIEAGRVNPVYVGDRNIIIEYAAPRAASTAEPGPKLFIGGFLGTAAELRDVFRDFHEHILSVFQMKDPRTGQAIGTGFVELVNAEIAGKAMAALDGKEVPYGTKLRVSYANRHNQPANKPEPMYGRSRGGGRGEEDQFEGNSYSQQSQRYGSESMGRRGSYA